MKLLFDTHFVNGQLPEGWIEQQRVCQFERQALRTHGGAVLVFPLPPGRFDKLIIETEVEAISGAHVTCSDGISALLVDVKRHQHSIIYSGLATLVSSRRAVATSEEKIRISFEFDRGQLKALAGKDELVTARDPKPRPAEGVFELGFWDDCLIHSIRAFGEEAGSSSVYAERENYELEVNVDFFDNLLHAPWTLQMFDDLFAEFKSWGVKRCHWIHYGRWSEGWWDNTPLNVSRHAAETTRNVGEIFPTAVQAAHRHGIEIYGLIKPFDMGLISAFDQKGKYGPKLNRIGGPVNWIATFPARHRELIMARKPGLSGPARSERFTRIEFVKDDTEKAAFSISDIQIFVSSDNVTYSLYDGPVEREEVVESYSLWEHTASGGRPSGEARPSRVMRLWNLDIRQPFVAFSTPGKTASFSNSLVNLIHVFGEDGEERMLTYGLAMKSGGFEITDNVSSRATETDFRRYGVLFDTLPGAPTSLFPGYDAISERWSLDSSHGVFAFAAGKNDGPLAALSPSFPEARAWWLSWVEDCLTAGADGIELRIRNHHSHLTWGEYGFEKPVRNEFLARHGVDLWATDDFDKVAWAGLRGEGYTTFCREVKKLTDSHGKKLGLHISQTNHLGPNESSAMNILWDWPTWLKEGIADSITLKDILPGSRFALEVMELARARGIRVIFCPYSNDLVLQPEGELVCEAWIALGRKFGCDGFQYYECAAAIKETTKGQLVLTQPALKTIFQKEFSQPELASHS